MHPSDAFGVAVRVVGLLILCDAMLYLLSAVVLVLHYRPDTSPPWHYLLSGGIGFVDGSYFLRGAPPIVRFAYRNEDSNV